MHGSMFQRQKKSLDDAQEVRCNLANLLVSDRQVKIIKTFLQHELDFQEEAKTLFMQKVTRMENDANDEADNVFTVEIMIVFVAFFFRFQSPHTTA